MSPATLEARALTKRFAGVTVLDRVDLTLNGGEIHGLLGENGSGKSTLIKILCGFHEPDGGALSIHGQAVPLPLGPGRPAELGLRFVHQDLGFVPALTAAENFHLGALASGASGRRVSHRSLVAATATALEQFGVSIDPGQAVRDLSAIQRALLAVVRAVHDLPAGRGILVLDEPTVFLPRKDVEDLFALVRRVAADGGSVLVVSHDLDEIREVTHRVSVLRDGRLVGARDTAGASVEDLVQMIVGRRVRSAGLAEAQGTDDGREERLCVEGLTGTRLTDVGFRLSAGEIVGVAGLEGSGAEELPYLLYGARSARGGRVTVAGREIDAGRMSPSRALAAGMVLIPADRRRLAGLLRLSVEDNLSHPRLHRFRTGPLLRRRSIRRDAESMIRRFDVRPPRPEQPFGTLSGGNQQKAVVAKWLAVEPVVLLLHEPTQGVDVGARQQILQYLAAAAAEGRAVLCASSDFEQLATLCHRVLVFRRGRIVAELHGAGLTKEAVTEACLEDEPVATEVGA